MENHHNHRATGRMLVVGKNSIVVETKFRPKTVEAGFVDRNVVRVFPSCIPVDNDLIHTDVYVSQDGSQFGIIISWNVQEAREIEWQAD